MARNREILEAITQGKEKYITQDGREFSLFCLGGVKWVSYSKGATIREVEVMALEQGIIPPRYFRNIGLIGHTGQIKLLQSCVAVVGAGGLGSIAVELLARCGIGRIIVIDHDRFTEMDLNRQLMATEESLGEYKVTVAARRVKEINSAVEVIPHRKLITKENARELIEGSHVVVDALDNLPSRLIVQDACRDLGIPFVHGAAAGFSGQLITIFPEDRGLSLIYGSSDNLPVRGMEVGVGILSPTPVMIAAWQVQEVIKIITGVGKPLRNKLLLLDAAQGTAEIIELEV